MDNWLAASFSEFRPAFRHIVLAGICGATGLFYLYRRYRTSRYLSPVGKAIFITGCDSGFGKAAAFELHRLGYAVFACCLDAKTATETTYGALKDDETFKILQLDVTIQSQVDGAAMEVKNWLQQNADYRLFGIINNAGIAVFGPAEWNSIDKFQQVIDVNLIGVFRVTKAMLPVMRRDNNGKVADGRIVFMASAAAELPGVGFGVYCCSKMAVLSLTDCLRMELMPLGIHVSAICPDFYATQLVTGVPGILDVLDKQLAVVDKRVLDAYGGQERVAELREALSDKLPAAAKKDYSPVINCFIDSIASPKPKMRYYPMEAATRFLFLLQLISPAYYRWFMMNVAKI